MHEVGLEPTRPCEHRHLKPASLPIPPLVRLRKQYITISRLDLSTLRRNFFRLSQHDIQKHHDGETGHDAHSGEVGLGLLVPLAFGDQLVDGH